MSSMNNVLSHFSNEADNLSITFKWYPSSSESKSFIFFQIPPKGALIRISSKVRTPLCNVDIVLTHNAELLSLYFTHHFAWSAIFWAWRLPIPNPARSFAGMIFAMPPNLSCLVSCVPRKNLLRLLSSSFRILAGARGIKRNSTIPNFPTRFYQRQPSVPPKW